MGNIKIGFDLDGTLYDTLPIILGVEQAVRHKLGYPAVSREDYVKNFQTKDWRRLYRNTGIKEEDIDEIISLFVEEYDVRVDLPYLIPGALLAIERSAEAVGHENIHIITNESRERVALRFERDGLSSFLSNVRNPSQDKAGEIYNLAIPDNVSFAYVGDIVSDGEACGEAIRRGASGVSFYGMLHSQAMNTSEVMAKYIEENRDFAKGLRTLDDVGEIWSR